MIVPILFGSLGILIMLAAWIGTLIENLDDSTHEDYSYYL